MLLSIAAMSAAEAAAWVDRYDDFDETDDPDVDDQRWAELMVVFDGPCGVDLQKSWAMVSELLMPEFGDVFFTVGSQPMGS